MSPIEKFIRENYTPTISENKLGMSCLFKHKEGLTEDSVVFFEFAKKGWTKKPIINKRQYVIVDADTRDLLEFLSNYFNLTEESYNDVRKIIVDMGISALDDFYGESSK
jgi:hypothetical protein